MTFVPEKISEFQGLFEKCQSDIKQMPGCLHLELWQDIDNPNVFITHSHWETEEFLNTYRRTVYFGLIWKKTKALFAERATAYSVAQVAQSNLSYAISCQD